jgi:hypothetical protein
LKIGALGGRGITRMPQALRETELAKCDLVCANCHRIRTKARCRAEELDLR